MLATTAAVGAVATGAFSALLPTPGDGTTSAAAADESPLSAILAANSGFLSDDDEDAVGPLVPVGFASDNDADDHLAGLDKAANLAAELAEMHAEEAREQARIAGLIEKGGLDGWIAEALQILDLPQSLAPSVERVVMKESGGNPRAVNTWDSNARRGTPSQGLMQTVPATYRAYVHPSLAGRPITDPVANLTAGIRYMIANYGMSTLEAGGRSSSSGAYLGY